MRRKTTEEACKEIRAKFGDKYDLSKVEYINNKTNITIICKKHGEFQKRLLWFLQGSDCPGCFNERRSLKLRKSTEEFITDLKNKWYHENIEYHHIQYIEVFSNITLKCKVHGTITKKAVIIMQNGICPCARKDYQKLTILEKIEKKANHFMKQVTTFTNRTSKKLHSYNRKITVINNRVKRHIGIQGRIKARIQKFYDQLEVKKHPEIDISKVKYMKRTGKVCVICPIHGEYYTRPSTLLQGCGCRKCCHSKGELKIKTILDALQIDYIFQKREFISNCSYQWFDFYLPLLNFYIEYDGQQHFEQTNIFGKLEIHQMRDKRKDQFIINNKHNLLRIHYLDSKKLYFILAKWLIFCPKGISYSRNNYYGDNSRH